MAVFELVLALLLGGIGLTLLAPRLGVPWPALLALAGAALAFVPGAPEVALDPQLVLALFVAPVLLDAAFDASPRDLRDNWAPVGGLVLGAVSLTVAVVAAVACWLEPSLPWAAAIALGAIVAPPDAAAATAVLRQVRLPHRIMVILEGESLLNDASALLIYRLAVGAVAGGMTAWTAPLLALAAIGGVALGIVLARAYLALMARVEDGAPSVVLQFLGTFGVWLLAEALQLSAVLTVVAYAVTLARLAPGRTGARQRRESYAVWDVAVFVLNVLAFVLVGLQFRSILARLDGQAGRYAAFAAAVLGTAILVRVAWVMGYYAAARWKDRRFGAHPRRPMPPPTVQGGIVVSWCGMRGIVTLAAALALPGGFPARDLIVFASFCVVLGTLVLQGLTLRPLLSRLALPRDKSVEEEVALARAEAARAALDALAAADADAGRYGEARHLLEREYR
ncbi:MAG TPA: sodium:proton antiporter, partial [Stellaceae bacterium]|nr:sodium:proton antiporter [Stellaceae bacterium]